MSGYPFYLHNCSGNWDKTTAAHIKHGSIEADGAVCLQVLLTVSLEFIWEKRLLAQANKLCPELIHSLGRARFNPL